MVKQLFGSNPRRIKLFLNAHRRAVYLASAQGFFDRNAANEPVTLEQLGKFAALTMRCPRLVRMLAVDPELLSKLEHEETAVPSQRRIHHATSLPAGMAYPGVRELLKYGVAASDATPLDAARFSLRLFPVARFLRVLPMAADPAATQAGKAVRHDRRP
jgi:hypothetical protein